MSAPLDATWAAVRETETRELKVTAALMALRSLGRSRRQPEPILRSFERMGFRVLAEEPERELVIGGIGRFWTASGGLRRVESREHFVSFAEPGYARTAFNFLVDDGVLSTETRIAGTDARATRLFGLYWLAIRPGSGLIRHEWLRAIDRRALLAARTEAATAA